MPIIRWDDFTGGEYGDLSPRLQQHNQWTGLNMLVYDNGRVGPRGGITCLQTASPETIADSHVSAIAMGNQYLVHAKTGPTTHKIFEYEMGRTAAYTDTLAGTLPATWKPGAWQQTDVWTAYLCAQENGIYRYVIGAPGTATLVEDLTSFSDTPASAIALYRDRLFAAGNDLGKIYYSVAQDFTDWTTTATDGTGSGNFNVGDGTPIIWMGVVGDQLWMIKSNQEIWAYQGFPGRELLRRILPGKSGRSGNGTATEQPTIDRGYQLDVLQNGQVIGGESHFPRPISITPNGVQSQDIIMGKFRTQFSAEPVADIGIDVGACASHESDGAVVAFQDADGDNGNTYHLIRRNGAWSVHQFVPSGLGTSPGGPAPGSVAVAPQGTLWLGISSNSETDFWPCYTLINQNKPGDGLTTYGTGSYTTIFSQGDVFSSNVETTQHVDSCTFETSKFSDEANRDLTIRSVTIEFLAFDTNSSDTNHFEPSIELRAADDGQEQTVTLTNWDEANSSASADGSPRRHVAFPEGGIQASMFSIKLSEIRGVAIESIIVEFDTDDQPRR